jgi:hypothetical protein
MLSWVVAREVVAALKLININPDMQQHADTSPDQGKPA